MGLPQFTYGGNAIVFPQELSLYNARRRAETALVFSASGRSSAVFLNAFDEVEIALDSFSDRGFFHALAAWWAWAKLGKPYAFALDQNDAVEKILSGATAAGQKVIPLADTTGIVLGRKYRLRAADGENEEVLEAASVNAGVSITAAQNLLFAYAAGDAARSLDFHPKVVSLDESFPAEEKPFLAFTMKHKFREVK